MGEKKKKVGRPSKKDDENFDAVKKLLAAFWRGCNITEACHYAGISRETYYKWCHDVPELSDDFDMARTKVSEKAKAVIVDAIDNGDINTAKWWLERRNKKEFSPNAEEVFNEPSSEEIAEARLQEQLDRHIALRYRKYVVLEREKLLTEYSKKNLYLISRLDNLMKLSDHELAEHAFWEVQATQIDKADIGGLLRIRLGGENYKDIIALADETKAKYDALIEAENAHPNTSAV